MWSVQVSELLRVGKVGNAMSLGYVKWLLNSQSHLFLSFKSEIIIPYWMVFKVLENLLRSPCNFLILSVIF